MDRGDPEGRKEGSGATHLCRQPGMDRADWVGDRADWVGGRVAGTGYEMILLCSVWKEVGGNDSLERIRMRETGFRGGSLFSPVLTVPSSGCVSRRKAEAQGRPSEEPLWALWRDELRDFQRAPS